MKQIWLDTVTRITLVGYLSLDFPLSGNGGNCFSMRSSETGREYRIANFGFQNLQQLQNRGLTFPLRCLELDDKHAIVDDQRIAPDWYRTRWCSCSCPEQLMPITQRLERQREQRAGIVSRQGSWNFYPGTMRYVDGLLTQCAEQVYFDKQKNLISNTFVPIDREL